MAKKSSINITKNMADKIPYLRCYEEQGIIETEYKVIITKELFYKFNARLTIGNHNISPYSIFYSLF